MGLLGLGAFAAINVGGSSHEPDWTTADLPPIPADNGWDEVSVKAELDVPNALSKGVQDDGGLDSFDRAQLDEFLATAPARAALARIDAAAAKPAFVDACPVLDSCDLFTWRNTHKVGLLDATALTLAGDLPGATKRIAGLVRLDVAHLETSHSLLSLLIAVNNLEDALATVGRIGERDELHEVHANAELMAAVEAISVEPLDLRAVVIGEYLLVTHMLETLREGDAEALPGPRWLFDLDQTLEQVDGIWQARYQGAVSGDVGVALGLGEPSSKQGWPWWARNAVGEEILDSMYFDPTEVVADLEHKVRTIHEARAKILAPGTRADHPPG